jgi:hypothetical protein
MKDGWFSPEDYRKRYEDAFENEEYVEDFNEENNLKLCYYVSHDILRCCEVQVKLYCYLDEKQYVLNRENRGRMDGTETIIRYQVYPGETVFKTLEEAQDEVKRRKLVMSTCESCQYAYYDAVYWDCHTCKYNDGFGCKYVLKKTGFAVSYSRDGLICKEYSPRDKDHLQFWKGFDYHLKYIRDCLVKVDGQSKCPINHKENRFFYNKMPISVFSSPVYNNIILDYDIVQIINYPVDIMMCKYKEGKMYIHIVKIFLRNGRGNRPVYQIFTVDSYMTMDEVKELIKSKREKIQQKEKSK